MLNPSVSGMRVGGLCGREVSSTTSPGVNGARFSEFGSVCGDGKGLALRSGAHCVASARPGTGGARWEVGCGADLFLYRHRESMRSYARKSLSRGQAKDIVNYLKIIHRLLAPGGVWINLGLRSSPDL